MLPRMQWVMSLGLCRPDCYNQSSVIMHGHDILNSEGECEQCMPCHEAGSTLMQNLSVMTSWGKVWTWHGMFNSHADLVCHVMRLASALMQTMPVMISIILRESVNSACHNIRLVQFTWRYCLGVIQAFMLVLCWVKGSVPSVLHKYMHNLMSLANKCPCILVCSGWNLHVL